MRWYPLEGVHDAKLFTRLCRLGTEFARHASIMGRGYGGLVVDHKDGTLTKAFFRHSSSLKDSLNTMNVEIDNLRFFQTHKMNGVKTPELVEAPTMFTGAKENPFYLGTIRMTKIKGETVDWQDSVRMQSLPDVEGHMRDAGRVLAEFYRVSDCYQKKPRLKFNQGELSSCLTSPLFSDEENSKLLIVEDIIRKDFSPRFVHGDFAGRNLLTSANGQITGIIDFGFSDYGPNLTQDFRGCYYDDQELLPHLIRGFNEHSADAKIDPIHVQCQIVSDCVGFIKKSVPNGDIENSMHYGQLKNLLKPF